jgi:hypothetical protein
VPGERIQATADDAAATHALILECSNWLRIKGVQQWNPVYPRQRFDDDVSEGKVWIWRSRDGVDATVTLSSSRPDYYPPHIWQDTATGWYVCRFAVARRLKSTRLGVRLLVELETSRSRSKDRSPALGCDGDQSVSRQLLHRAGIRSSRPRRDHGLPLGLPPEAACVSWRDAHTTKRCSRLITRRALRREPTNATPGDQPSTGADDSELRAMYFRLRLAGHPDKFLPAVLASTQTRLSFIVGASGPVPERTFSQILLFDCAVDARRARLQQKC